jgi:RHS repeat-associated protein
MKCITILENITTHGRNARVNGVNAYLKQGTSLLYVRWMGAPGAVSYSIEFVPIGTSVEVQLQGSGGVYFVDAVTVTEAAEEASEYQSAIAQVVQTNDYSPFGAPLAGRTYKPIDENGKIELVKVTFDSGTDGWVSNGATLGNSQGRLQLLTYNAAAQRAQKTYTNLLTIGKKYRVSFDFVIDGITTASFTLSNGSTQVRNKLTTITTKEVTEFTATATNLTLLATLSAGNYGRLAHIDNLVIEEIFEVGEGYRFGFNGMEKDNNTYGEGNAYDFGARIYDSRLGRFLSIDRFAKMYPFQSPYTFAANNPIIFLDAGGDSITVSRAIWKNGEKVGDMTDEEYTAFKEDYIAKLQTTTNDELAYRGNVIVIIHLNNKNPGKDLKYGTNLIRQINRKGPTEKNTTIVKSNINYTHYDNSDATLLKNGKKGIGSNSTIEFNPDKDFVPVNVDGTTKRRAVFGAIHELIHALHGMLGVRDNTITDKPDPTTRECMKQEEINTRTQENVIRTEGGEINRKVTE